MNLEKLAKLQALSGAQKGGKGTPRKLQKKIHKPINTGDDKKLQATLKKLNCQPIAGIDEVNMFMEDGTILHFTYPKGIALLVAANTSVIFGTPQSKQMTELVPDILTQIGPDGLESLKKMAAQYQQAAGKEVDDDDDQVPELVDDFEEISKK